MVKKFFSFGDKSGNTIVKVILITAISMFAINSIIPLFPKIFTPFTSYGIIIFKIKHILDFIVKIIYIRVICEIIYLVIRALKVYINKNENTPTEDN